MRLKEGYAAAWAWQWCLGGRSEREDCGFGCALLSRYPALLLPLAFTVLCFMAELEDLTSKKCRRRSGVDNK